MIMEQKCPYCGSVSLKMDVDDDEWSGNDAFIRAWSCTCENGHRFIMSEVLTVTSRLVATDQDELDRLIAEEESEER